MSWNNIILLSILRLFNNFSLRYISHLRVHTPINTGYINSLVCDAVNVNSQKVCSAFVRQSFMRSLFHRLRVECVACPSSSPYIHTVRKYFCCLLFWTGICKVRNPKTKMAINELEIFVQFFPHSFSFEKY